MAYLVRGRDYIRMSDYTKAVESLNTAIAREPLFGAAYHMRATAYADMGMKDKAVADLAQALILGLDPSQRQQADDLLRQLKSL